MAKKRINAREFAEDFRSGFLDLDLMLKYDLNEDDLRILFKKLRAAKILSEDDLRIRLSAASRVPGNSVAEVSNREPERLAISESPPVKKRPARLQQPSTPTPQTRNSEPKTQACPFCSKETPLGAVQCIHCRGWLDGRDIGVDTDIAASSDRSHAVKVIAKGIAGMLVGVILQLVGGKLGLFLGTLVFLASTGYYVWGCCVYITTKGYHLAVGLLGLVPCFIGLIILVAMPEK